MNEWALLSRASGRTRVVGFVTSVEKPLLENLPEGVIPIDPAKVSINLLEEYEFLAEAARDGYVAE